MKTGTALLLTASCAAIFASTSIYAYPTVVGADGLQAKTDKEQPNEGDDAKRAYERRDGVVLGFPPIPDPFSMTAGPVLSTLSALGSNDDVAPLPTAKKSGSAGLVSALSTSPSEDVGEKDHAIRQSIREGIRAGLQHGLQEALGRDSSIGGESAHKLASVTDDDVQKIEKCIGTPIITRLVLCIKQEETSGASNALASSASAIDAIHECVPQDFLAHIQACVEHQELIRVQENLRALEALYTQEQLVHAQERQHGGAQNANAADPTSHKNIASIFEDGIPDQSSASSSDSLASSGGNTPSSSPSSEAGRLNASQGSDMSGTAGSPNSTAQAAVPAHQSSLTAQGAGTSSPVSADGSGAQIPSGSPSMAAPSSAGPTFANSTDASMPQVPSLDVAAPSSSDVANTSTGSPSAQYAQGQQMGSDQASQAIGGAQPMNAAAAPQSTGAANTTIASAGGMDASMNASPSMSMTGAGSNDTSIPVGPDGAANSTQSALTPENFAGAAATNATANAEDGWQGSLSMPSNDAVIANSSLANNATSLNNAAAPSLTNTASNSTTATDLPNGMPASPGDSTLDSTALAPSMNATESAVSPTASTDASTTAGSPVAGSDLLKSGTMLPSSESHGANMTKPSMPMVKRRFGYGPDYKTAPGTRRRHPLPRSIHDDDRV